MSRVLFIEDDPSWQRLLGKKLETAGHEAKRATDFDTAIEILGGKERFNVIVFDLRLGTTSSNDDPFVWLDAFIDGLASRRLRIPPIIILTGIDITHRQVAKAFAEHRGVVFDFFEKESLDHKEFMRSIKEACSHSIGEPRPRSLFHLIAYTLLMSVIVLLTFSVLLWSVGQVSDPKTQQTILQVGGAVIVVIAIFITVFSQNTKIEDVVESLAKIMHG
jgi:CheY-like chemotaxis protein